MSADQVIARLRAQARAASRAPTCSCSRCRTSASAAARRNAQYQFTLQADELDGAARVGAADPRARWRELPELADVNTDQQDKGLQTSLVIDRDTASRLGVTHAR